MRQVYYFSIKSFSGFFMKVPRIISDFFCKPVTYFLPTSDLFFSNPVIYISISKPLHLCTGLNHCFFRPTFFHEDSRAYYVSYFQISQSFFGKLFMVSIYLEKCQHNVLKREKGSLCQQVQGVPLTGLGFRTWVSLY